jgi:2-phosphosulfolactate phosphatase
MPAPDLPPAPDFSHIEKPVRVFLHMDHAREEDFVGRTAVVFDCLRATSTIAAAMEHGAVCVHACLTVERAREVAASRTCQTVLGGERGGVLIDGFDLDNSPLAYTREQVNGREVVFTTANGTAALLRAKRASRIVVGSLLNVSAVADAIKDDPGEVVILCSGTREQVSLDDVIGAGALVHQLIARGRSHGACDASRIALMSYLNARQSGLAAALADSRGGVNLRKTARGLADIEFCARQDIYTRVLEFDSVTGVIT